jgi:hypothetical protein
MERDVRLKEEGPRLLHHPSLTCSTFLTLKQPEFPQLYQRAQSEDREKDLVVI